MTRSPSLPGTARSAPRRCRRAIGIVMGAILLAAAALRFTALPFGSDTVLTPRSDEEIIRFATLHSMRGDLNPHYAVWGHLFHYIYVCAGSIYLGGRVLAGLAPCWIEAIAEAHCAPATFVWIGRAISATAGTATVFATYVLGRRAFRDRMVGLGAAALLATAFLHVRDSHFATTDVLATCCGTAALAVMSRPGGSRRAAWAGMSTGIALAAKLSTVALVPTFLTLVVAGTWRRPGEHQASRFLLIGAFVAAAAAAAIALQPFMVFDPMQTIYGLFGDMLAAERMPFASGMNLDVPKVMLRYYVPQAMGWLVGGLAILGAAGFLLVPRARSRWLVLFALWTLLPLVSVRLTYLRYLGPLIPLSCVFASAILVRGLRQVMRRRVAGRPRAIATGLAIALVSAPNLYRSVLLDHRLLQEDTRTSAKHWIERHVPPGSRIVWIGFGTMAPHLSMPWLQSTEAYDRSVMRLRSNHGLSNEVEEAILRWKQRRNVPTYNAVAAAPSQSLDELPGYERFPFIRRRYPVAVARRIDDWGRRVGLLNDQTPYGELMRRYLAGWSGFRLDTIRDLAEPWIAVARMPPHVDATDAVGPQYERVAMFTPGWTGQPHDERDMLYDWGDAWWLPNIGLGNVRRPGPEIYIYRLKHTGGEPSARPQPVD